MSELDWCWVALFGVGFLLRLMIGLRHWRGRERQVESMDTGLEKWLLALCGLGLFVVPWLYVVGLLNFADIWWPGVFGWAGVGVYIAGLVLFWCGHVAIGESWHPGVGLRARRDLVTSGPYRWIRHPIYAAHWLLGIGQILLLQNWVAGPAFLLPFVLLYGFRVEREEGLMLAVYGGRYREYMARTGRLIPPVRKMLAELETAR